MTPEQQMQYGSLVAENARNTTILQLIGMMKNCRMQDLPYWAVLDQLRAMLKHKDGQP